MKRFARRSSDWRLVAIAWSSMCLAVLALIASAKVAEEFVAPTVLGALIAITLSPLVRTLERRNIPSAVASAIVVLSVLFCSAVAVYSLAPSAEDWRFKGPGVIRSLERKYRDLERTINEGVEKATAGRSEKRAPSKTDEPSAELPGKPSAQLGSGSTGGLPSIQKVEPPQDPAEERPEEPEPKDSPTQAVIESGQQLIADKLLDAPKMLLSVVYASFLCYFMLAERTSLRRAMLSLGATRAWRLRIARAAREIRLNVSSYLLTLASVNLGLGVSAALIFWMTGLPNPLLWGVMVGLLNFMPYVGPMISNIVIFIVGLATFPRGEEAFLPVILMFLLNMIEGQLVTPHVVGRRFEMGPLAVFLALAFGAWLWGFFGALVATPVLIVGATLWRSLYPQAGRRRRAGKSQ